MLIQNGSLSSMFVPGIQSIAFVMNINLGRPERQGAAHFTSEIKIVPAHASRFWSPQIALVSSISFLVHCIHHRTLNTKDTVKSACGNHDSAMRKEEGTGDMALVNINDMLVWYTVKRAARGWGHDDCMYSTGGRPFGRGLQISSLPYR